MGWDKKRENRKYDADLRNEPLYLFNKFYACERILLLLWLRQRHCHRCRRYLRAKSACFYLFCKKCAKWNLHKEHKKKLLKSSIQGNGALGTNPAIYIPHPEDGNGQRVCVTFQSIHSQTFHSINIMLILIISRYLPTAHISHCLRE